MTGSVDTIVWHVSADEEHRNRWTPAACFATGRTCATSAKSSAAPPQEQDLRSVLAIKAFRRLWISLSLSSLGDWLGFLATTSAGQSAHGDVFNKVVRRLPGSCSCGCSRLCSSARSPGPGPTSSTGAGTMVVTDVLRFGFLLSVPLFPHLWWLLIASFLIECASLFWIPAKEASIPNLVPRNQLEAANQLNLVTTYGFGAVAAGVVRCAGLPEPRVGAQPVVLQDPTRSTSRSISTQATFLVSALTIINLSEISKARAAEDRDGSNGEQVGVFRSITEGMRFLGTQRWLKGLVLGVCGATGGGCRRDRVVATVCGGFAGVVTLPTARCSGAVFVGLASGMFLGPRFIGTFSRRAGGRAGASSRAA